MREKTMRKGFTPLAGIFLVGSFAIFLLGVGGCATLPETLDEDLSASEMFRFAQDAYNLMAYERALSYYGEILEKFRSDRAIRSVSQYEIAYIHFKIGNSAVALPILEELLIEYQRDRTNFPRWVHILSTKVYEMIVDTET